MSIAPVTTPGLGLLGKRPPTHVVEVDGQRVTRSAAELPSKVRRFLLLEQPKLSGGFDACGVMFYSLLMVHDASLNSTALMTYSCFSLGEIVAILAGLSIALPISLRAATSIDVDVVDWATAPRWNAAVNLAFDNCHEHALPLHHHLVERTRLPSTCVWWMSSESRSSGGR